MPESETQSDMLDLLPLVARTITNRLRLLERVESVEAETLHINTAVASERRELLNLALRAVQLHQAFAGIPGFKFPR